MICKHKLLNHLRASSFIWIGFILIISIWNYFNISYVYIPLLFHFIFSIPAIYLHLEYYFKNKGIIIELGEEEIIVKNQKEIWKYKNRDISKIIVYKSNAIDEWGVPFIASYFYYYIRIVTLSNEEIIITCLMVDNKDKILKKYKNVKLEMKTSFFNNLSYK